MMDLKKIAIGLWLMLKFLMIAAILFGIGYLVFTKSLGNGRGCGAVDVGARLDHW